MKATNRFLIAIALLGTSMVAQAQGQTSSPYSRIGYGMLGENATGMQRHMGGVGVATQNGHQINVMNPASYSQTDSLTFMWDIGVDLTNVWMEEIPRSRKGHNFGGGLDYITSCFRIANHLGGSFGLVPYSSVGYSFGSKLDNGSESRSGDGSLSELYLGAGWEPFKNFSLGVNFSYLFGTITNSTYINSTSSSSSLFLRTMELRDWNVHVGAQYGINLSKDDRVVIGATYSPKKSFHGHTWGTYNETQSTKPDTVQYMSMKGRYEMPNTIGAGISFTHGAKFFGEIDFTYQDWSKTKYEPLKGFESDKMQFNDRWKVAAGMQYVPDPRGSYLKRIAYRIGGFYNNDYQNVQGNKLRDYGLSLGFGFPALGSKTLVNLGVEWKHRYTAPTNLIKEDYLNVTLSVTFNEMWFWKNKIR
jgi:hypothetical protein